MSTDLNASTHFTPKILCSTQLASTSATAVYTVPSSSSVRISHGTICNVTGSPVTVTVAIVPASGSDDGSHTILHQYPLDAHDTKSLGEYLGACMLTAAESISVTASSANAVDVVITGTVHS